MKIINTQRPITQKAGKPELVFMCSAYCVMVINIGVKVIEWTRKLLIRKGQ